MKLIQLTLIGMWNSLSLMQVMAKYWFEELTNLDVKDRYSFRI